MADRSGGSVVIRLGVAGSEQVRAALAALGREGQTALKAIDTATKRPTASALALNDAMASLRGTAVGFAGQLGPLGAGLQAFGGKGLLIAAGIGAAAVAAQKSVTVVGDAAQALADISDRAEEFGLSTDFLQGVQNLGVTVGRSVDEVNSALARFTAESAEAAKGQGALLEAVKLYAPAAAEYVRWAHTQEDRARAVARALQETATAEGKAAISRAAFGRSGLALGSVLGSAGGDLDAAFSELERHTTEEIAKAQRIDALYDQIGLTITRRWQSAVVNTADATGGLIAQLSAGLTKLGNHPFWLQVAELLGKDWFFDSSDVERTTPGASPPAGPGVNVTVNKPLAPVVPLPTDRPVSEIEAANAARRAAAERAATAATRDAEAATRQRTAAEEAAARVRAELGNVSGVIAIKERELQDLVKKGALNQDEATAALARYREEQEKTAAVARATFPQLAQLGQQATDLKGAIDTGLTSSLRESASAFADISMGTVTFSEGLAGLARSLQRTILEMIWMKTVVGPLAQMLGGIGGGMFGGGASFATAGMGGGINASPLTYGGPRAAGGSVEAGKFYAINERGQEWFAPGRSGTMIPAGGAAPQVNVNIIGAEQAKVEQRRNPDGGTDIMVMINQAVDERVFGHHFQKRTSEARGFERQYGLRAAAG
jgi:hypothetical protein